MNKQREFPIMIVTLLSLLTFIISSCEREPELRLTPFPHRSYPKEVERAEYFAALLAEEFDDPNETLPSNFDRLIDQMKIDADDFVIWHYSDRNTRENVWMYTPDKNSILTLTESFSNGRKSVRIAITKDFKVTEF